jgi:hypothetical protein
MRSTNDGVSGRLIDTTQGFQPTVCDDDKVGLPKGQEGPMSRAWNVEGTISLAVS